MKTILLLCCALLISIFLVPTVKAQEESKQFTIHSIELSSELTRENQILFSKTFGVTFNNINLSQDFVIIRVPLVGRDSEFIRSSIKVSDEISGEEFVAVYKLQSNCAGQFKFEDSTNYIYVCTKPKMQMRIEVGGTILDKHNLSEVIFCGPQVSNFTLSNDFTFELPSHAYTYFFSAKSVVAEGIDVGTINESVCQFSDATLPITVNRLSDGFYCQGVIPPTPSNKSRMVKVTLGGWDRLAREKEELAIQEKKQEELQQKYINASTSASEATIRTKNVPWINLGVASINLVVAVILVIVTASYAKTTKNMLEEAKKASAPQIIAKILNYITRPVLRIRNVGHNAAIDVRFKGTISLKTVENKKRGAHETQFTDITLADRTIQALEKDGYVDFLIWPNNGASLSYNELINNYAAAQIIIEFKDTGGQAYPLTNISIDLSHIQDTFSSETNIEEAITRVAEELRNMNFNKK